jgi:hypothetical protein
MRTAFAAILALAVAAASTRGADRKFYPDDPLRADRALVDVPEKPAVLELSDIFDALSHTFRDLGKSPIGSEASDINTLDEVLDGPWFVNRHGTKRMSLEDLVRGPNEGTPPSPPSEEAKWVVFRSKTQGITPGFDIRDPSGDRYVIKLDPVEVPELASAAEVISTKIFHAIGYHVPENHIVRVHPDNFVIEEGTLTEDSFGDKTALTPFRFRRALRLVPRLPDGRIRVVASKYVDGIPIGHRRYYGTRTDDPNDIVPHEDRREQRGLRLFSAWLNHDDTRAQNTIDAWVPSDQDPGMHYVRHYLLDFGSTLGSGSVKIQNEFFGYHYWLEPDLIVDNILGFGFHVPEYRKVKWPEFPKYQAVGRFESERFDPVTWKSNYPNPAFQRMTARDAFWAAKILMKFTRDELAAIVETGEYSDPDNARLLLEVLLERQKKCGRFGINGINPLDGFRVENGALVFRNLSEEHGFGGAGTSYEIQWFAYDNDTGSRRELSSATSLRETRSALPSPPAGGELLLAEIRSSHPDFPHWRSPIGVYLRVTGTQQEIVGIDRESPEASTSR